MKLSELNSNQKNNGVIRTYEISPMGLNGDFVDKENVKLRSYEVSVLTSGTKHVKHVQRHALKNEKQ